MAIIITIGVMKGGVGKTSCTLNLAYSLAKMGKKVLCIDGDGQANLSSTLGKINPNEQPVSAAMLFDDNPAISMANCITKSKYEGIDLIPAKIDMLFAASKVMNRPEFFYAYKDKLDSATNDSYDFILIDTPPAIDSAFVYNALAISDYFIVPVEASSIYALQGLDQYLATVKNFSKHTSRKLALLGIVLTKYDGRATASRVVEELVRKEFGDAVFNTTITKSVVFDNSTLAGEAVAVLDKRSSAARCCRELAEEVMVRCGMKLPKGKVKDSNNE